MIIGAGGLGLMCLGLHQKMGGHSAIVVDIDPAKREAAKRAGAAAVIDGGAPDAVQQIMKLTKDGAGAWAAIDLVGSSASARVGFDSLIKGGKYIIVGLYGGDFTVSLPPIPMRALTIQGSYLGSLPEMAEMMDLVRRKGLPDVPVTTRPLDDGQRRPRRSARRQDRRPRGAHAVLIKRRTRSFYPGIVASRVRHAPRTAAGSGDADGRQRTARHAGADQGALQKRSAGRGDHAAGQGHARRHHHRLQGRDRPCAQRRGPAPGDRRLRPRTVLGRHAAGGAGRLRRRHAESGGDRARYSAQVGQGVGGRRTRFPRHARRRQGCAGRLPRDPPALRSRHRRGPGQARSIAQAHRALLRGVPDHQGGAAG